MTNDGNNSVGPVTLHMDYPANLDSLNTPFIDAGGAANSVECIGNAVLTNCAPGEVMVVDLNNIPAGGGVTVSLPPEVVNNTANGTLIPFDAEVRVDGTQELLLSKISFVGSVFRIGHYPGGDGDFCFPIKAKNGIIAVICL